MNGELNIYGVFVPALFAWALIALALSWVLRHALAWIGFYRLVWHRPLFDLARCRWSVRNPAPSRIA
jgi:hypothetical protein